MNRNLLINPWYYEFVLYNVITKEYETRKMFSRQTYADLKVYLRNKYSQATKYYSFVDITDIRPTDFNCLLVKYEI